MRLPTRQLSFALLVVLTLGLVAVSVHGATHTSSDFQTCEYCSGHANPAHGIPVSRPFVLPPATSPVARIEAVEIAVSPPFFPHRQRAPPYVA